MRYLLLYKKEIFYQYFFFILFIFSPRIHFFQIPGSTSDLRLDIITMLFFGALYFFINFSNFIRAKKVSVTWLVYILLIYISIIYILVSRNSIYAIFQIFWYMTMLFAFFLSQKLVINFSFEKAIYFVRIFININALMHLTDTINWRVFGNERIGDLAYGFFEIPSPFALVLGCYTIITLMGKFRITKVEKFVLLSALLFSESRIGAGAFILTMVVLSRYKIWFMLLATFAYFSLFFIDSYLKALSFLTLTIDKVSQDPSLLMRGDNFNAMTQWWESAQTMWLGGGVLSHMDYSIQFGKPGPLDSLYLKMLSDFGLISFILFIVVVATLLINNSHLIKLNFVEIISPIMFVAIYSLVNEGLVSVKSGHLVFFLVGLIFWSAKADMSNRKLKYNACKKIVGYEG